MGKIIHTLFINFSYYFLHYFCVSLILSALTILIVQIIKYKKQYPVMYLKEYMISVFKKKDTYILTAELFYIFLLFQSTVFDRVLIRQHHNPFSDIFGGWTITETLYFYDLSPLWNIVIFIPVSFMIKLFFDTKTKDVKSAKLCVLSVLYSFVISLLIENFQIVLSVGTFQLSDLLYNSLGGLLGFVIYIVCQKTKNPRI